MFANISYMFANIYVMFANIKVMFANICDGLDVAQIMIFLLTYVREHYLMSIYMFANICGPSGYVREHFIPQPHY